MRPTLVQGIRQVDEGDFENGLLTLDTVVRDLAVDPAQHKKDLSQGYLYRGIAFIDLGQEDSAKGSFAAALHYDKSVRLAEDRFPPRVVRVFEAVRHGVSDRRSCSSGGGELSRTTPHAHVRRQPSLQLVPCFRRHNGGRHTGGGSSLGGPQEPPAATL